ncbi:HYR domain-containing protein [Prolixibacter sp. SD074]|uniref:HYR domain-containing protein n=1 Tax=Prolixibacter sp. SD074 TaxID=2652391 RepID=UPI001E308BF9|nr:HYR domain-containing protein [Prolixibacter sp. SD074]
MLGSGFAFGKSTQWTDTSSSSWTDPANWNNGVPGAGDDVTIPWLSGFVYQPIIDADASMASLTMNSNPNTLTVASGVNVTISGNVTIGNSATFDTNGGNVTVGGQLSVNGNLTMSTGSGTINAQNSTITMDGSTWDMSGGSNFNPGTSTIIFSGGTQLITGSGGVKDITFYNLTANNGAQVTSDIDVIVNNSMNVVPPATFNVTPGNTLTANSSISITEQPVAQEVCEGSTATFTVVASGATSYQWRKNSVDISSATSSTLSISNATSSDEAVYDCVISDGVGTVYSDAVSLTVNPLPSVSLAASSSTGCSGGSITLTATSSGGIPNLTGSNTSPGNINDYQTINRSIVMPSGTLSSASELEIHLNISHTWVGDLVVTLKGPGSIGTTTLFDRVGYPQSTWGNSDDFISSGDYVFSTSGATVLPEVYSAFGEIPTGTYKPSDNTGNANNFSGLNFPIADIAGTWTLSVSDNANSDSGVLNNWSLTINNGGVYTTYFSGPGNIGPITYSGANNSIATATVTPASTGVLNYTATTSDPNSCSSTSSPVSITVNTPPTLTATPTDADFGQTNGSISATASGGLTPYQFSLDSGPYQASGDFTNLSPGTYTITVEDASGCSASSTVDVNEKPDTQAPQFTNCSNDTTVIADPTTCTAKVWYNIPTATDNGGAYASALPGFSYLGDHGGHSYYLSTDIELSKDTHVKVFDNGGHLATITSAEENNFLKTFAEALGQDVWFGFTDAGQEGQWRWVTGEDSTLYTNWNSDEPNNTNSNENWAEMYGTTTSEHEAGSWNDQFDTDTRYFFLEFDGPRVIGEMQNEGETAWQQAPAPGSTFSTGIHHMRFTATDASGNTSICTFDINVTESEPPTITVPADVSAFADAGSCYATNVDLGTPATSDNCGVKSVTNDAPTSFSEGTTTVTWTVTDKSGNTATDTQDVTVTSNGIISGDDQTTEGDNSWIGHIYNGTNFQDYYGQVTELQLFDEGFGGNYTCYDFSNSSGGGSIYTETFSVHYRMHTTTLDGIYLVDIGSDDGARLYVDNNLVYTHWSDRAYATDAGILFSVNGDNHLLLDFYENTGANRISFGNLQKVTDKLASGTTQSVCINTAAHKIVGNDAFTDSPISSNTEYTVTYQWQESTDGTTFTDISGASSKDYTPQTTVAGKTYYQRILTISRTNPGMSTTTVATSVSDIAEITVNPEVSTPVFTEGTTSARCQGAGTVTYSATAANSTAITYSLDATSLTNGNSIDASTGEVTYADTWSGTSVITVSAEGCGGPKTATHTVTTTPSVGVPTLITVSAGSEPACPPEDGTLTTTYSTTATNSTGLVWSIDNLSAGSIDSSTGEMTWAQGFSGTVNIKVEASGCNGPTMASRKVTVIDNEPPTFDPSFTYGNLTECATDELSQQATLTLDLPVANTDNCGTPTLSYSVTGNTTVNSTVVTGPTVNVTFNEGLSTVTYTLDDGNGNTNTLSFTVTIDHKPNPGIIIAN